MVNYANGKIYKLVSNVTDEVYYGSTTQSLALRKTKHKNNYKQWKEGNYNYTTCYKLFKIGDVDIILVENYSCNSKEQLHARERFHIENNDCLNRYIPGRTNKEWRKDNKEKYREYMVKWKEDNKDKIKQQCKEYRERNKDKIKQRRKEKITCKCGSIVTIYNLSKHKQTKKHLNRLDFINE